MRLRVLTWNLMHGRAVPGAGRDLLAEFTAALATWHWDVALLQEVPPWWGPALGQSLGAAARTALTSRNSLLTVRRALATHWPDLIKSNGGGANVILVRGAVAGHRRAMLRWWPERRLLHGVEVGRWLVGNLHAQGSRAEAEAASRTMLAWSGGGPTVLGGDFNLHGLELPGWRHLAGEGPDHLFSIGLDGAARGEVLPHGRLSDHDPVLVSVSGP